MIPLPKMGNSSSISLNLPVAILRVFFAKRAGLPIWLELAGGIDSVRYQPSKEHLDNQIPNTIKQLRDLIQTLQKETGADDRFIQSMLNQLSDSYGSSKTHEGGFGFR